MINFYYDNERGMLRGVELRQTNIRGFYGKAGRGIDAPRGTVERGTKKKTRTNKDNEHKEGKLAVGYIVFMDGDIIYWEFKRG